ncbi:MAG: NHL repeat-containing protein [Thermomicrobiales bacterium]|nr:NHL repeat-containing protein [Thermomicrobiales bacterium]
MNERNFDDLTRRVGDATAPALPRRGLFGVLGGGALAGLTGLGLLAEDAEARKKKNKNKNKKKKNKKCKADGKKCKKNKDCCDSKCSSGRCGSRCPTRVSFNTRWGSFGTGNNQFRNPWDIAISRDGEVFVTDTDNRRVQVFDESGGFIRAWGGAGNGSEQFQEPRGVGANQDGSRTRILVSDPGMNSDSRRLRRFNTTGGMVSEMGRSQMPNPRGIAIDSNNRIWVVDNSSTGRIFLFDSDGSYNNNWVPDGNGALSSPHGIAVAKVDKKTFVYVTDAGNNRVVKFEYSGSNLNYVKAAGSRGSGSSAFNGPAGIAADSCGNLWVADRNNNRIQILDQDLSFKSRFTASFDRPTGVAFGTNTKQLFVVDSANAQVQKFSLSSK